jgi:hypothetical protein
MTKTPRELLAAADDAKRTADAAEFARTLIRLFEQPEVKRGLLGFWRRAERENEEPFVLDEATTAAVYDALELVRDDHRKKALEYESQVEVKS